MSDRRNYMPRELSGGQQRVAIARALIGKPEILFADEPTGNLDSKTGAEIMNILQEINQSIGQTILIVTHSPEAAKSSSRVITVQDGMILSGAHAQSGSDNASEKMVKTTSSLSGISCKKNLSQNDIMVSYQSQGGYHTMSRNQEQRHVYYDHDLGIEAYQLSGVVQKFPNHFHDFYVIGFIEGGQRHLWCKGQEYDLRPGDLILFNPRDNHYCSPISGELLDYRALNIKPEVMQKAAKEITGKDYAPCFTRNVVCQSEAAISVGEVYDAILEDAPRLQKEETFFYLLEQILQEYAAPFERHEPTEPDEQIQNLCAYMEQHYADNISLDTLLSMTSFGKTYLLRSFTKQLGVSPYRYLQTIRIDRAKKLLEQGVEPIEAADRTGFSDQSHFTNFFKSFIGLTPKQYQRIFIGESSSDAQAALAGKEEEVAEHEV